jgi:hypothetical protein
MYIGRHVKCPLFFSDFNGTWIFSTDFRKILKYKVSCKFVYWEPSCSMRTDGRTHMKKIILWTPLKRDDIYCVLNISAWKVLRNPISVKNFTRLLYGIYSLLWSSALMHSVDGYRRFEGSYFLHFRDIMLIKNKFNVILWPILYRFHQHKYRNRNFEATKRQVASFLLHVYALVQLQRSSPACRCVICGRTKFQIFDWWRSNSRVSHCTTLQEAVVNWRHCAFC